MPNIIVRSLKNDLPGIAHSLQTQREQGLVPLFVIGAGASNSQALPHVPSFNTMLKQLHRLVGKQIEAIGRSDKSLSELSDLFQDYLRAELDDSVTVTRILMEAQSSASARVQDCWDQFSKWLLLECLEYPASESGEDHPLLGIVNANPTPAHDALAGLYERVGALCVSLNFDGLTRKALLAAKFERPLILDDADKIERFFCRKVGEQGERKNQMVAVVKLRGDAFMAACQGDGCPLREQGFPLWDLDARTRDHLRCPACQYQRKLEISFPGIPQKELAAQIMLRSLWKYFSIRVGSIFVVGFSGRWDHTVANSLITLARDRDVPTYVVREHPEQDRVFPGMVASAPKGSGYFRATADEFLTQLLRLTTEQRRGNVRDITELPYRDQSVAREIFWNERLDRLAKGSSVREVPPTDLEKRVIEHPHFRRLASIAQLGLKNYWLGISRRRTEDEHNRNVHSIGTMRLASLLYQNVHDQRGRSSKVVKLVDTRPEGEMYFLRLAALLHDLGHMPFSHMLEEVFDELSWTLDGDTRAFRHTDYTEKLVRDIFAEEDLQIQLLQQYGYTPSQLVQLIHGAFGVHYLDALINSAVDVDKIDYVFRDTHVCELRTTLPEADEWLRRLLESGDLAVSPEGFLKLGGEAASLFLHLLQARQYLYETFYLSPMMRFPEALTRFLLVLCLTSEITPKRLRFGDPELASRPGRDLGQAKILAAQDYLFGVADDVMKGGREQDTRSPAQYEFAMVSRIVENLKRSHFHPRILEAVECIGDILQVHGRDELIKRQAAYTLGEPLILSSNVDPVEVRKLARDAMLRKPGAVVIDIVRPTTFLSSARHRELSRVGYRGEVQDCVLAPEQNPRYWKPGDPAVRPLSAALRGLTREDERSVRISIFRVSENQNYARQARDLFLGLLRERGLI